MKIQLGRADQSFAQVCMTGLELKDDVIRLKQGQPGARRRLRNSGVRREVVQIQQLPDTSGAQANEALEQGEVTDLRQLAQIALDKSFEIVGQHLCRIEILGMYARVSGASRLT